MNISPAKLVGWTLSGLSLAYIGWSMIHSEFWTLSAAQDPRLLFYTALAALGYGLLSLLLANAWAIAVSFLGTTPLSFRLALPIFARTQLDKYIPGNVVHFFSRHVYAHQNGLEHGPLLGSALAEILALLTSASLVALGGFLATDRSEHSLTLLFLLLLPVLVLSARLLSSLVPRLLPLLLNLLGTNAVAWAKNLDWRGFELSSKLFLSIIPFYLLFFLGFGGLGFGFALLTTDASLSTLPLVIAFVATGWLAGFIIPGAPGGLGVREAVLLGALTPLLGESSAIVLALGLRLVSASGDFILFLLSLLIRTDEPC